MNKSEKRKIEVFAREGFARFYSENHQFLELEKYRPGKKPYRNMSALNKMMYCYLEAEKIGNDYIVRDEVKEKRQWPGPSTYTQYARSITDFGLSDTSASERDRSVLLLSENGKKLRNKYKQYMNANPCIDLLKKVELPEFARRYVVKEIRETTSHNMTLWKNVILSSLYLYVVLGYIPKYSKVQEVPTNEKNAFVKCCNYVNDDGSLKDVTYFTQPAHMLKNLGILNDKYIMTDIGYKLILNLSIFKENESSFEDYKEAFEDEIDAVEEILDSKTELTKVDAPERKSRKASVSVSDKLSNAKSRNFDEDNKRNKKTGDLGEQLVYDYERKKLELAGIEDIDDKLIRTSEHPEYGNAYPCDFLSVDVKTGKTIFIEVKTTRYSAESPFFISEEERAFSEINADSYRLYRVFDAIRTSNPKFYEVQGYVGDNFSLTSNSYIATRVQDEKSGE